MRTGEGNLPLSSRMSNLSLHDVTDDQAIVATNYDLNEITKVAEYAKGLHNAGMDTALGGDKLVASVHPAVIHKWCADRGVTMSMFMTDQKLTKQFLEDPDNRHFRVWKGAI